jgi:hypothetical protein
MTTMYDAIEVSLIPAGAEAVAGYVGGRWPTAHELPGRFPHAKILTIAISASEDADVLDIEAGDAEISQAAEWVKRQHARGLARPACYCSLSKVNELHASLLAAGIHRENWRLWSAHYTNHAHICGPDEGITTFADATQWTEKALGRNLDQSLCSGAFFGEAPKPNEYQPRDEANWCKEWDRIKSYPQLRYHLRRLFLRHMMLKRRKEITAAARKTGWDFRNRLWRYHQLQVRTG